MDPVFVVAVVGALGLMLYFWQQQKSQEKAERLADEVARREEILTLVERLQVELKNIDKRRTPTAKANACGRAQAILHDLSLYEEASEYITNFDELRDRIPRIQRVLPVVGHVERAYKHRFKQKDGPEKNALLDALYDIRTNDVTNDDFWRAEVMPEGTGEIITIESIEARLHELGWRDRGQDSSDAE